MSPPVDPGERVGAPPAPDWRAAQPPDTALGLPAHCYVDPRFESWDRRAVLGRGWQLVAHAAQLARPGDHTLAEVAGVPLVLLRDHDGQLRAWHNVCRHRGGPLVREAGSDLRRLTCRYHGWTYGLDGVLRGAPGMRDAVGFDPACVQLPAARVRAWQGLVFACLDATVPAFDAVVAGIDERLGTRSLASLRFARRVVYELDCDWKLYVDNYLEGYHVAMVHPGLNALLDAQAYETSLAAWHSLQHSPLRSDAALYGQGEALYYFVYPNTMLNILPGRLQTNRVLPCGVGRCRVEFDYHVDDPDDAERLSRDIAFSDEVQAEDARICVEVQRAMASGSYQPGRLNPTQEKGVWHFHELLRRAYREAGVGDD